LLSQSCCIWCPGMCICRKCPVGTDGCRPGNAAYCMLSTLELGHTPWGRRWFWGWPSPLEISRFAFTSQRTDFVILPTFISHDSKRKLGLERMYLSAALISPQTPLKCAKSQNKFPHKWVASLARLPYLCVSLSGLLNIAATFHLLD
jgi:hypothetical protein